MKKLLLCLFLANASLHAMEGAHIVPFNVQKHGPEAQQLFKDALHELQAHDLLTDPQNDPEKQIRILEHDDKTIGLVMYYHEQLSTRIVCPDIYSTGYDKECPLKICRIGFLAVDARYRGQGLGRKIVRYVTQEAIDHIDDIITLHASQNTRLFYEKEKFLQTIPALDFMAKPLNTEAAGLLSCIIQLRKLNGGKSVILNRYLM